MEKDLVRDIIDKMPKDLTDMEKARYIYIAVCRFFVYDPRFLLGDSTEKAEIFNEDIDIKKVIKKEAVCSKIARAYMYLLDYVGIKCNGIYIPGGYEGHLEVAAEINGKIYDMNPTADLMNVKMGYQTTSFAENVAFHTSPRAVGFDFLKKKELKAIDDKIGYTCKLKDEYYNKNGESKFKQQSIYMDDAERYIGTEFFGSEKIKAYVQERYPEVDINSLLFCDIRKYKFEFLVEYINNFANDLNKIDKRDLLERLAKNTIEPKGNNYEIYNGNIAGKKMVSVVRCNGLCSNEDVFYKIEDNSKIEKLDRAQIQNLLDSGFKGFKEGRESELIRNDGPFQDIVAKYYRRMNEYWNKELDPQKKSLKQRQFISMNYLQECNKYIAQIDKYIDDGDIDLKRLVDLNNEIAKFSMLSGVEKIDYNNNQQRKNCDCMSLKNKMEELKKKLTRDAMPLVHMVDECKNEIKKRAIEQNVPLYHISTKSPEEYTNGIIKPFPGYNSIGTKFGKYVDATTRRLDSNIETLSIPNNGEVYDIPHMQNAFFLDANNIHLEKHEGKAKAMLNSPGYAYYMNPKTFNPDVKFGLASGCYEYGIFFDGDWMHEGEIDISRDVTDVEEYSDVTSVLGNNQIILNINMGKDELIINNMTPEKIKEYVIQNLRDKRIRYLNGEIGINDLHLLDELKPKREIVYSASKLMDTVPIKTPEQVTEQKHRIEEFLKNALNKGISKQEYEEHKSMKNKEAKEETIENKQQQKG